MYPLQKYRKFGFGIALGLIALGGLYIVLPFWQAIAWGGTLAILVYPLYQKLRARFSPNIAAFTATMLTLLFIMGPLVTVGIAAYLELNLAFRELQSSQRAKGKELTFESIVNSAENTLRPLLASVGIKEFDLRESLRQVIQPTLGTAPQIVRSIIKGVIIFVFTHVLLFFLLRDGRRLHQPALEIIPLPSEKSQEVLDSVHQTVNAVFYGVVLVAVMQGIATGLLFFFLGVPAAFLWGLAAIILCAIPFVGAPVIYVPMALLLAFSEEWTRAIILLLGGLLLVSSLDNIFRPIIISQRVPLHPIAVFFSLIGGILSLGPVGLVVGPVLLCLAVGAVQIIREIAQENKAGSILSESIATQ